MITLYKLLFNNDNDEIECVYHTSDTHIRNDAGRFKEYDSGFENFYKILGNDKRKKIVVLTGDILHEGNRPSALAFSMMRTFFRKVSEICPLIVTRGNHDCNMNNENDPNFLFEIVDEISKSGNKIYYCDYGTYRYCNILFGVTNIYSEQIYEFKDIDKKYYEDIKQKNKYIIALCHRTMPDEMIKN